MALTDDRGLPIRLADELQHGAVERLGCSQYAEWPHSDHERIAAADARGEERSNEGGM